MSGPAVNRAVNPARGEVAAPLGGEARRLCLTLGALAELEGAFSLQGWGELAARLRASGAADLRVVLEALLRGGGASDAEAAAVAASATPREAAEAVAAAFLTAVG